MIKLFSSTNCSSSKKMKQWLITNKLEFEEISILENTLLKKDILETGVEEIISKRSSAYKKLSKIIDFDALTLNSLVELIVQNQKLLRRPLVVDEHRLQVGYNEDDIRKFLPRKVRQLGLITAIENVRIWDQAK